ncbi:MAG: tetratricopeptide repeat protein [Nitrospinae bacterium]|nr:tetratricopeptide repeat protein [Nitrospinota bacterium]MBI3814610.1 tetratricopeptide repeat protein [Nitrospinota bacterium]
MKYFSVIIIAVFLFFLAGSILQIEPKCFAETKEIISEGTYNMGDGETPGVAESRALLNAKRVAIEQAGTYVESYTKVKNLQLTEDEIKVMASGIMEVAIIDKKRTVIGDGFNFWVKIKAKVNLDNIEKLAGKVKEKSVVEDYKKIQEAYDKSQKEIEELKKQLAQAKGEPERKQVEAKIADKENLFQANEWFEKGNRYSLDKQYDEAIDAYTKAVMLNPDADGAYVNRGNVYLQTEQYDKALEDYNKASEVLDRTFDRNNPNLNIEVYANVFWNIALNRGYVYEKKGEYDKAIEYYNSAIKFKSDNANAYFNRGRIYLIVKSEYDKAIEDYSKVIEINPENPDYSVTANDYKNWVIIDGIAKVLYKKIKSKLTPHPIVISSYLNRGFAYHKKGQYDRAIEDYSKGIDINQNIPEAYLYRGNAYADIRDIDKAISDFQ